MKRNLFTITLMCAAALTASAQVSKTKTTGGAMLSETTPKASLVIPASHPPVEEALPASASVIYSNFGTGSALYNADSGWTEAGQEANDEPITEAMSFVPASNFVLVRLDIALTYVQGTNGTKVIIAEDNAGVPGKPIYAVSFTNLPEFGTCCTVQTMKLTPSSSSFVALKGGATYWIYPLPADTTSYIVWNLDTTGLAGNGAVSSNYGKAWSAAPLSPFGAFDLYGVKVGQ